MKLYQIIAIRSTDFKRAEIETIEVDVPIDKAGLLAWLNAHGSAR